jgi:hypothetical protein
MITGRADTAENGGLLSEETIRSHLRINHLEQALAYKYMHARKSENRKRETIQRKPGAETWMMCGDGGRRWGRMGEKKRQRQESVRVLRDGLDSIETKVLKQSSVCLETVELRLQAELEIEKQSTTNLRNGKCRVSVINKHNYGRWAIWICLGLC